MYYLSEKARLLLWNERIVFPDMMKEHRWMYDTVTAIVYFIELNGQIEWVLGEDFEDFLAGDNEGTVVLGWAYICTVRTNDRDHAESFWITQEEYSKEASTTYRILEIVVRVVEKDNLHRVFNMSAREWNDVRNGDMYDIISTMYRVTYIRRDL